MSKKKAVKTISLLWAGSLLGAGCAFLTQVILARRLGPNAFGTFAAALTTVTTLAPIAGFGISQYWLKAFGQEGWQAMRWLPSSFRFVKISTILVLLALVTWGIFGPHDELMRIILMPLSLYVAGQVVVELISSKLQLEERFIRLSFWQTLPHLMRLSLVTILAFGFSDWMNGQNVAWAYASIASCLTVLGGIQLRGMYKGHFHLKGHALSETIIQGNVPSVLTVISQAWPFGLAGLFHLIYFQSDIILVKYITGSEAAGVYNVAFTVMVAVYLLPSVIFQKYLLPKIHRWAHHDRLRFYQIYRQGNIAMLILGIFAMLVIWISAPWAIPLLFGKQYEGAVLLLNILAICAPILFVAISIGATLVTQEHMKRKVKVMGFTAVLNIVLNILLIPPFGAVGAASATVFSNLILLLIYYIVAQKTVFTIESKQKT